MSDSVVSYGAEGFGEFEKRMIMRDYEFSRHTVDGLYKRIFHTERMVALVTVVILGFMIVEAQNIQGELRLFAVVVTTLIGLGGYLRCDHLLSISKRTLLYIQKIEETVMVKSCLGLQRCFAEDMSYFDRFEKIQRIFWVALLIVNLVSASIFVLYIESPPSVAVAAP
ncbi:MAG: hypothetical protein AAFN27_12790 [Pseudomonadota bacterium]